MTDTNYEKKLDGISPEEFIDKVRCELKEDGIETEEQKKINNAKQILGATYELILEVLRDYSDLKEKDYKIIALWIIGTYYYKNFPCYPYLFLNAMKGAGKSRTLRLITTMSWNGKQLGSMTEAGLFRIAGKGTIGIDEFEGISKKENHGLREILNAGYKKGMKIIRMKKVKTPTGEEQVAEEFDPYTPILLANIWGMEEVLGDRCITLILEKSSSIRHTKKIEDFDADIRIKSIKANFELLSQENIDFIHDYSHETGVYQFSKKNNYTEPFIFDKNANRCIRCSYFNPGRVYREWNNYINNKYNITTLTTLDTQTTLPIEYKIKENEYEIKNIPSLTTLDPKLLEFFNKMDETELNGRDLELFIPLFIISYVLDYNVFKEALQIAKDTTTHKKQDEITESKDVSFLEYISKQDSRDYYKVKDLTYGFRIFIDYEAEDEYSKWLNNKWVGRALKRLELFTDKRRLAAGIEVTLNIHKAREKLRMFK